MSYNIRPAKESDVPAICEVYFDAYGLKSKMDDETRKAIREHFLEQATTQYMYDSGSQVSVMTDSSKDEKVVALSIWIAPKHKDDAASTKAQQQSSNAATGADYEGFIDAGKASGSTNPGLAAYLESREREEEKHEEIMKGRPHWTLLLLAVRADYQGKGLGGRLMESGMELADKDGLPQFIIASPAGKRLYEKHGFETVENFEFTDSSGKEHANSAMLRTPPREP
ncbi:Uu.00g011750.m01.CDS01 [Anthostomella pinea]|uniref:Uu.00g011750.m01.CDS01 n=1 Tax=Anthostomella pinea TaxID=933095 RepID=A0AAI8YQ83_9PEZI|nr:Uu.00g011750.m01.CDS01 [Anthostomella pinea]